MNLEISEKIKFEITKTDNWLDSKNIKSYNKIKTSDDYITFHNKVKNYFVQNLDGNKNERTKMLEKLKFEIEFKLNQNNKALNFKNGIISFIVGTISGAFIDAVLLKQLFDIVNSDDITNISILILIIITFIILYGIYVTVSSRKINYYENLLRIVEDAISELQ